VETLSRHWLAVLAVLGLGMTSVQVAAKDQPLLAHGAADAGAPAWAVVVSTPAGWTRDCCTYARVIGADAVLYQGEWSGKPQRVMVLNVTERKLPTLAAEVQADRKRYQQRDPHGRVGGFSVRNPAMPCQASVYQGSDHIDDVVVFCDPGKASGVRLSWSMAVDADDASRRALFDDFMRVVVASRYQRYAASPPHGG
jgi:hypothetical protein